MVNLIKELDKANIILDKLEEEFCKSNLDRNIIIDTISLLDLQLMNIKINILKNGSK